MFLGTRGVSDVWITEPSGHDFHSIFHRKRFAYIIWKDKIDLYPNGQNVISPSTYFLRNLTLVFQKLSIWLRPITIHTFPSLLMRAFSRCIASQENTYTFRFLQDSARNRSMTDFSSVILISPAHSMSSKLRKMFITAQNVRLTVWWKNKRNTVSAF